MSSKKFCDFCGNEITEKTRIPTNVIDYCHEKQFENDHTKVIVDIHVVLPDSIFTRKDICKHCVKELVGQL
jgi:hypothetical protein